MSLSNTVILPGQTIGIIGGGQLGRMMALAAKAMGFRIAVLDPEPACPCSQVADVQIVGKYDDLNAMKQLAELSDVITYEFENIDAETLSWLCENANVPQGMNLLAVTQNRITEKASIVDAGLEVVPYAPVETVEQFYANIEKLGFPSVLKTATGGYDGKGQVVLKKVDDLYDGVALLDAGPCVLEKWLPFEKEISVIVTRSTRGEMTVFPVSENVHHQNILHKSIVPARVSPVLSEKAIQAAKQLAEQFQLVGTLAVEMFITNDKKIYINEMAPRPHNSGHFTIDACETSQFEQHIRAVCNWPLGSTELLKPAVMVNILGEHMERLISEIPAMSGWKIHLYGKNEAREKRKMGHVTVMTESIEASLAVIDSHPIWKTVKEKIGGLQ